MIESRLFAWTNDDPSGSSSRLGTYDADAAGVLALSGELLLAHVPHEVQLADGLILARLTDGVVVINVRGDEPRVVGEVNTPTWSPQRNPRTAPDTVSAVDGWLYVASGAILGYELPAHWLSADGSIPDPTVTPTLDLTPSPTPTDRATVTTAPPDNTRRVFLPALMTTQIR